MKKKVSETSGDLVKGLSGLYDFGKNIGKSAPSSERQRAYEIFRKNFITDIADLIDYGIDRGKFTLDAPPDAEPEVTAVNRRPGSTTTSYPSDFKGSKTWANTKDWLEMYRDELESMANKEPEVPPPPKPQIRSQMSLPIDSAPEPGVVPQTSAAAVQKPSGWKDFDRPAYIRNKKAEPQQQQMTAPGVSEPVTFGGVKYYKVNGKWVNAKGKPADKNTSNLLDRVPLDESFPVTATVNGVIYKHNKGNWYCDDYKAEGELLRYLNESYLAALVETINYKKLQTKYTQLLESNGLPTLGQFLYNSLVKKHIDANELPEIVKRQIEEILNNLQNHVVAKNKTQLTKDIETIASLIFNNSYNLMPRLLRNK